MWEDLAGFARAVRKGDRIFVSSPADGKNRLICLSRKGEKLWEKDLGTERPGKHKKGH